jgi:hypothetical protein
MGIFLSGLSDEKFSHITVIYWKKILLIFSVVLITNFLIGRQMRVVEENCTGASG